MINAETQLLYSSDYPHWDFDLPSTIWDLPFLSEKAKHNILGGTAARLFKLPPRNEKQKENLKKFGNLAVAAVKGPRMHKHAIRIDRTKPLAAEPHTGHNRYHPDIAPVTEVGRGRRGHPRNPRLRRRPDRPERDRRRPRARSTPAASIR